jgi:hypothetical protein
MLTGVCSTGARSSGRFSPGGMDDLCLSGCISSTHFIRANSFIMFNKMPLTSTLLSMFVA